nr:MAG TPA: hypothetical protein [Caudoviricetes sp.]
MPIKGQKRPWKTILEQRPNYMPYALKSIFYAICIKLHHTILYILVIITIT